MRLLSTRADLEGWLDGVGWRQGGGPVIVPTMGALHEGHGSLVERGVALAKERGVKRGCAVWVFVNPTQFNDHADLERYPRTLESDIAMCDSRGAAAVFAPGVGEVYPAGEQIAVPELPRVAMNPGLEDAFRPGHFAGVLQVVRRFFGLMRPSAAVFGEKDWQQLCVVRAMAEAEGLDVAIVPAPTVREADGLAMSSRNRFLAPTARRAATSLSRALCRACGETTVAAAERAMRETLLEANAEIEYAVVRDDTSLMPVAQSASRGESGRRALIAARVGTVRLIDNCAWQ